MNRIGLFTALLIILMAPPVSVEKEEVFDLERSSKRPNVLLILADDMGYSDLSCYGSEIPTPNIDELAFNGVRFTQFYNGARCCPSRASLLTGLHPHQTGLGGMTGQASKFPGYQGEISKNCVTIAEALKSVGYKCYMAGKWHLTGNLKDTVNWPKQRGFDRFFGSINGGGNFFYPNGLLLGNTLIEPDDDFYYTDRIATYVKKFISEHEKSNDEAPFFVYAAFTAPHFPLHAPDSSINKFKGKFDLGWDVLRKKRFDRMKELGLTNSNFKLSKRDSLVPPWVDEKSKEWEARRMEVYTAQMYHLDVAVGRIVDTLKDNDVFDDTLIMFLSDNGGCAEDITMGWYNFVTNRYGGRYTRHGDSLLVSNNPKVMPGTENTFQSVGRSWANLQNTPFKMYKHYTMQGGIATPLIVHWPRNIKQKGSIFNEPYYLIDVMPTILKAARTIYPKTYGGNSILPQEGISMLDTFFGLKSNVKRKMYWEHENNKAIREGDLKLVSTNGGDWKLYNLEEDPIEDNDLSNEFPKIVRKMKIDWRDWAWRTKVYPKTNQNNR